MTTTPASTGEMDHLDQLGAKAAGRTGAKAMLKAIRPRWSIENSWHWVREVPLREDANRYREDNGVQILATLRSLAINALRLEGIWSITPGRGSGWRGRRGLRSRRGCSGRARATAPATPRA